MESNSTVVSSAAQLRGGLDLKLEAGWDFRTPHGAQSPEQLCGLF